MTTTLLAIVAIVLAASMLWQKSRYRQNLKNERKRGRRLRKEALNERDQLLDALGDAFLLVDETNHIIFANARARDLLKGRRLKGRSIIEAFYDDALSLAVMKCIRTGIPMSEQVVLHSPYNPLGASDGRAGTAWVIDAAPLAHHDHGEALSRVVLRDITAEHQTEQVRRDFVANASHELRTPMAIINGYLENLIDDDVLEDPVMARQFLLVMQKHGARISRLVEDMLMISKIESAEFESLTKTDFSLHACSLEVVEQLEHLITKQQAQVKLMIEPDDLSISGDPFYWSQIIFNLVENALKQNPDPGLNVTVEGKQMNPGKSDEYTRITISDDGVGIPSADIPYLFKRFYRVNKHHPDNAAKGTGLGLSIVRRAVEAHGGKIAATSTPGVETSFTISLPAGHNELAEPE